MRRCVISDIHGCYDEFNALLEQVHYNASQDELILLGDYVDRGPKSKQVIEQIMQLRQEHGVVVLKGNHDAMMVKALKHDVQEYDLHWIRNGGLQTLASYRNVSYDQETMDWQAYAQDKQWMRSHYSEHLHFLDELPLSHEIPGYIFVHAGINPDEADWRSQSERDFIWIREAFYTRPTKLQEVVIFGHTPVMNLHDKPGIWMDPRGDKIGIDGGCAYGAQLNLLQIDEAGRIETFYVQKGQQASKPEK
ncbi:serine/threonine protein phosphatase [Paenibacillus barcinonensis]|uniref:Serine/threonine protein phosphatase n=1 Tax=Paenibacillus barcinonensis TaxID=198119 RepID=A0A2V4VAV7_PAEBA|nr:metallophosphoesterase family protein [Paenibacillus barcinonensis]PYE50142.1 serine/threonine protein phosphatase 1 [Paenibacillus barcinonensis]QKS59872.1 serine/threonine protein phosphatase [Paenibacillus barcinonensis]